MQNFKSTLVAFLFLTQLSAVSSLAAEHGTPAEQQQFTKRMQELDIKFIEAFNKKDAATIAAIFSPDAVSIGLAPQASPPAVGREAIQKGLQEFFKSAANYTDKIAASGLFNADLGWMSGPMSMTIGGKPAQGNWAWVLVRENGDWKTKFETYAFTPPEESKPK